MIRDGNMHTYRFDMSDEGAWDGNLNVLRIDPLAGGDAVAGRRVEIDYIRLLDGSDVDEVAVVAAFGLLLLLLRWHGRGDEADPALEVVGEPAPDDGPGWRKEKEKADRVREEARSEEDGTGEENKEAIKSFLVRKAAFGGGFAKVGERFGALSFCEGGSENGGEKNDREGGGETDLRPESQKEVELRDGNEDEEEKDLEEHLPGGRSLRSGGRKSKVPPRSRRSAPLLKGNLDPLLVPKFAHLRFNLVPGSTIE